MGWSLRKRASGRRGGQPPVPRPRLCCDIRGNTEKPWTRWVMPKQEVSRLRASCLSTFIHPPPTNPIRSYMRESPGSCCAHFWYPGKVTACQEKNHTAKPLQAGLLNAQRAFSSREISQVGHQPRVGPESSLGPAMGPVIHIPGNLAVAELLITWAPWSSWPWAHVSKMLY